MANASKPQGLQPVGLLSASPWNAKGHVYCIPSTDGNAFAVGDPVVLAGSADANGIPTITLATAGAGNAVLGSLLSPAGGSAYGTEYGIPAESPVVIPASKTRAYYVLVSDDPATIYEAQEDGVGGTIAAASVGLNVDLISGVNNGFVSGWLLDSSTVGTGATIQCKLLRARPNLLDNALGASCKWQVLINNHVFRSGITGL